VFQDNGGELVNALLYRLGTHPTVASEGKIYWNTTDRKAYVYNGTQWIPINTANNPIYTAGVGVSISTSNIISVEIEGQGGLEYSTENKLKLKADPSEFTLDGDGLSIKLGGLIGDHLAPLTIPDSKLQQIVSPNKVASSAVEDKFLRNDGNDVSSGGLTLGGTITAPDMILLPQSGAVSTVTGKLYFNDSTKKLNYYDGTAWLEVVDQVLAGVQDVQGTSPITVNGISGSAQTGSLTIAIDQSNATTDGYLSSTDWNTFNAKQDTVSAGDGIDITGTVISTAIKANAGLDTDAGELYVKLKSGGSILVDSDGLYWDGAYPVFQTVHDRTVLEQGTSDITFRVDTSGSLSIENYAQTVSILQVRDGDAVTSLVTTSNLNVVGRLTAQGDEARLVTDAINCKPLEITMAFYQAGTPASTDDGKFTINRGTGIDASIVWDESELKWGFDNATGTVTFPPSKYTATYSVIGSPAILTILQSTHGLGVTDEILVQVMDDSSPRQIILPTSVEISTTGDITITFDSAQNGKVILFA
jgi:hypothetical protein